MVSFDMERFEIEDMVAQDPQGVVFRARIQSSGAPVAIRRFFPFGRDGKGLEEEEAIAFSIAATRLASLKHPALRSVIEGSVDPIDGMPYLVSEWIEGVTLPDALNGDEPDLIHIVEVMRLALEVSLVLSDVLGEEALWVETDPQSILVGDEESGRGFTFWISPFKWLGADAQQRNLSDLVKLGEGLAGWDRKMVGEQAGNGLGGWFKRLKANPDTSIREALDSLAACTSTHTPSPIESPVETATAKPAVLIKQPSSKAPLIILAAFSLLLLGVILLYLHRTAQAPVIEEEFAAQEISEVITETEDTTIAKNLSKTEDRSEITSLTRPEEPPNERTEKQSEQVTEKEPTTNHFQLTPDDRDPIEDLDNGTEVTLSGVFRSTRFSGTGKSLYLEFESDAQDSVRGVVHQRGYPGDYSREAFAALIGKTITLKGAVFKDNFGNPALVKILTRDDISEAP